MTNDNPGPWASPQELGLPLDKVQLAAAKATVADNVGAQWTVAQAISLQIGGNPELKYDLARLLVETGIPTWMISNMTGISGRELREIVATDPISLFPCVDCGEVILAHDLRHLVQLTREHRAINGAQEGDRVVSEALCAPCTEARLQHYAEENRVQRLAQQARKAQLKRMPFEEYRLTPEWQIKRTQALSRAGYRCQTCSRRDTRLDVHHSSYERYGDESIYDLVVLCAPCHELFHETWRDAS